MKSCLLCWVIFFANAFAQAGFDYNIDASAQSYPSGTGITATGGYGFEVWRDETKQAEKNFWQYGYVRPSVELKSSFFINRLQAAVDLYPVSIFGITAGAGKSSRNYDDFDGVNCNTYLCEKSLAYKFLQARLIGGFGQYVIVATGRYDWYGAEVASSPVYEETSYLIGKPGGDDLKSLNVLAIYQKNETWSYGLYTVHQQFLSSESNSASMFGVINYVDGNWRGTLGAGTFRSSYRVQQAALLLQVSYSGMKSIALF